MPPLARLRRAAEFERVLGRRRRCSTEHFALYHLAANAMPLAESSEVTRTPGLSTSQGTTPEQPVDDAGCAVLIGAVVPKRHARRAVTRTLLKRAIYAAAERHRQALIAGWWVVRLRGPFDRAVFVSAASAALRVASRQELDRLFSAVGGPSS